MGKYVMALDQGTTSSRCIIYDRGGNMISSAQKEFKQIFPKAGWVEHDAMEIWSTQAGVAREALTRINASVRDIDAIGITNQRETTVVWDKETGIPIHNAIVWQCRRTSDYCDKLKAEGYTDMIRQKTGLLIDSYFSGTKLRWILENVKGARKKAKEGKLLFGTIETWLIWKLSGGKIHVTDYSNASRTLMFNINPCEWDKEILDILDIPECMLPQPMPSSCIYGETDPEVFGGPVPISGAGGDQQSALFGQTCFEKGQGKMTYGTGGFLLINSGEKPVFSDQGILTTLAWGINDKKYYALEGSVFVAGAAIQWLRDQLGIIKSAPETEKIASSVADTNGAYLVPAFTGLGAPYWDQYARGAIVGLTRGVSKAHLVRATVESLAYQTVDLIEAMEKDTNVKIDSLRVDGGACANNFLMQFQADILGRPVIRPSLIETTSLGAAYFAGLATGYWKDEKDVIENWKEDKWFYPQMKPTDRERLLEGWHKAVETTLGWAR